SYYAASQPSAPSVAAESSMSQAQPPSEPAESAVPGPPAVTPLNIVDLEQAILAALDEEQPRSHIAVSEAFAEGTIKVSGAKGIHSVLKSINKRTAAKAIYKQIKDSHAGKHQLNQLAKKGGGKPYNRNQRLDVPLDKPCDGWVARAKGI